MDIVMIVGFILFMVWMIRGYHANKYDERFGEKKEERGEELPGGPKEP